MNTKITVTHQTPSQDPAVARALQILEDHQGYEIDEETGGGRRFGGRDSNSKSLGSEGDETNTTVLHSIGVKSIDDEDGTGSQCPWPLIVILSCLALAILIPCLFVFGVIEKSDLEGVPVLENIDLDGFFDSDPFNGQVTPETPEAAYKWPTDEISGLELELLNALDDKWQPFYEKAMSDWENGEPDTLTLTSRRIPHEVECDQVNGVMKVCNGDYGETDWRGLNVVLLDFQRQFIYASSAKMNEFFLSKESNDQKQYTMCHELGHGFGLPHWDENFFNRNIGNCMDYTDSPRSNAQPDRNNFEFLANLYGVIGGTAPPAAQDGPNGQQGASNGPPNGPGSSPNGSRNPGQNVGWAREDDDDDRRRMEGDLLAPGTALEGKTPATKREVSPEVMDTLNGAARELETSPGGKQHTWNVVKSEEHGEILERDLGDGFIARAYKLRAV